MPLVETNKYIVTERTKLYYWVCLRRLWEVRGRKKMSENEKY
jgi:hypothetical protein